MDFRLEMLLEKAHRLLNVPGVIGVGQLRSTVLADLVFDSNQIQELVYDEFPDLPAKRMSHPPPPSPIPPSQLDRYGSLADKVIATPIFCH